MCIARAARFKLHSWPFGAGRIGCRSTLIRRLRQWHGFAFRLRAVILRAALFTAKLIASTRAVSCLLAGLFAACLLAGLPRALPFSLLFLLPGSSDPDKALIARTRAAFA